MKTVLIHNNNTSLSSDKLFKIEEQFVFQVDLDKDLDLYIHEKLQPGAELSSKLADADVVFIKIALSTNYLEYQGIRLAYHIRLADTIGQKNLIPIVLLGHESFRVLGATVVDPMILLTKGIYLADDTLEGFREAERLFSDGSISGLPDLENFICKIEISAPSSYRSHHSITNEWSILRWASVMGISDKEGFRGVRKNIENFLYYKFLRQKLQAPTPLANPVLDIQGSGKILYIDDEWKKGWHIIFEEIFKVSSAEFITFEHDFKNRDKQYIVDQSIAEVKRLNPDVVLLDLRLADGDFEHQKCKEMSGCLVLNAIKDYNPGIQVVMITASNKVWNLTELQRERADGFVLKESPELSIDESFSKNSLEQFAELVTECLTMSFLKKIFPAMENIRNLATGLPTGEKEEFEQRLNTNLDIAFELLRQVRYSPKYFNYAYLQLFQIIEDFTSLPSVFSGDGTYYVNSDKHEVIVRKAKGVNIEDAIRFTTNWKFTLDSTSYKSERHRPDVNFIVSTVIIFRLGQTNSSYRKWTEVYTIRNSKAAHFNTSDQIDENHIGLILNFIDGLINQSNVDFKNTSRGLAADSMEDGIAALKAKFNS